MEKGEEERGYRDGRREEEKEKGEGGRQLREEREV